uniref:G_PROTEIN_RECEP_F1_2 domain-containing protein n=1 Tax=Macrostomum lignano TaxID=282301 RepID=A0A1I8F9S1_9PLAT
MDVVIYGVDHYWMCAPTLLQEGVVNLLYGVVTYWMEFVTWMELSPTGWSCHLLDGVVTYWMELSPTGWTGRGESGRENRAENLDGDRENLDGENLDGRVVAVEEKSEGEGEWTDAREGILAGRDGAESLAGRIWWRIWTGEAGENLGGWRARENLAGEIWTENLGGRIWTENLAENLGFFNFGKQFVRQKKIFYNVLRKLLQSPDNSLEFELEICNCGGQISETGQCRMDLKTQFTIAQTVGQGLGIVLNLIFVRFTVKEKIGTSSTTILLRSQSMIDTWVMIFNLLFLQYFGKMPEPSQDSSDAMWYFYCYVPFSQILYWSFVCMSVYNLVMVSAERCLCLCAPFWYREHKTGILRTCLAVIIASAFFVEFPYCIIINKYVKEAAVLEVNSTAGNASANAIVKRCVFGDAPVSMKSAFGIAYVILFWMLPFFIMLLLYSLILLRIRASLSLNAKSSSAEGNKIGSAALRLTFITAITSCAFVLLFAMDSINYLKFNLGIDESRIELLEHLDSFMVSMNSAVNPFIYLIFMPQFRRFVFGSCGDSGGPAAATTSQTESVSAAAVPRTGRLAEMKRPAAADQGAADKQRSKQLTDLI